MLNDPTDGALSRLGASGVEPSSDQVQTSSTGNPKIRIPRLGTAPVSAHRQRTSRACAPCHQRKTKCDGQKPQCKQCRQLGIPCTYVGSKREQQKWALESVQAKIQSYESLLQRIITDSSEDPSKFKLIEELITVHKITDRRQEKLLTKNLYAEIQRLWEVEKHLKSLPTAQSSILIGLLCCTFGLDRFGTQYIMHGAQLCLNLGLQNESPSYFYGGAPDEYGHLARSHKLVAWAVKVPAWKEPPPVKFSPIEAAGLDAGVEWSPYPFATPISQPFFFTAACFRSDLVTIVHQIAKFALQFPDAVMNNDDWEYGRQLHQKLLQWKATLPPVLLLEHNTTPHIFCANLGSTDDQISNPKDFDPYIIMSQALDDMGSLILLFKRCHGWKSLPVVMLHYFCVAGVHSVSKLNAHEPKWSYILEDCVVGLWHMSLGWGRLCTAFLRTIELVLKQNNPDPSLVPSRVVEIFRKLNEGALWTVTDISSLAADYVVYTATQSDSSSSPSSAYRYQGLQDLINDMDNLSINLSSESPESLSSVKEPYDSRSSEDPDIRKT
ncbi:unnamed protein product [Aspergillus oryzae var. brunneus]|uniref:Unnamed protein product n=2 Tax=Aspergillus oryzae TaxID=5062 RepID=A0AAN4YH21_ASPOZ|nr:unnamed protein product [Aspergillus oryzae]GMG52601.1 unnamed protein product [Aspergillus oryzae var. brunneus]